MLFPLDICMLGGRTDTMWSVPIGSMMLARADTGVASHELNVGISLKLYGNT